MAITPTERVDSFKRTCEAQHQLTTKLQSEPDDFASMNPDYFVSDIKTCPKVDFNSGPTPVFYKPKDQDDLVEKDKNCFYDTLHSLIPQSGFTPPWFGKLQVLDVACGEAMSAQPLANFFGGFLTLQLPFFSYLSASHNRNTVYYTGIDTNAVSIGIAKRINPNTEKFNFVTTDALQFMQNTGDKRYDVILVRHPGPLNNDADAQIWEKMITTAYSKLAMGGILMVTNYNCFEFEFAKDVLKNEAHAHIPLEGINPYYFVFDRFDGHRFARDRYVIFADKQ